MRISPVPCQRGPHLLVVALVATRHVTGNHAHTRGALHLASFFYYCQTFVYWHRNRPCKKNLDFRVIPGQGVVSKMKRANRREKDSTHAGPAKEAKLH
jgi:hypothetical protein